MFIITQSEWEQKKNQLKNFYKLVISRQKHNLLTGFSVHGMEFQRKLRKTFIVFVLKGSQTLTLFKFLYMILNNGKESFVLP